MGHVRECTKFVQALVITCSQTPISGRVWLSNGCFGLYGQHPKSGPWSVLGFDFMPVTGPFDNQTKYV
jgi:hypothetical protein